MKTPIHRSLPIVLTASLAAAAFVSPNMLSAAPPAKLQVAADVEPGVSLQTWLGKSVLGREGQQVGEIRDFLADERTGELAFAVVSAGGVLGLGETLRLVPIHALTASGEDSELRVPLAETDVQALLALDEQQLGENRIRLEHSRASAARAAGANLDRGLLRLSTLPGRSVHVGDREVGEIEHVQVDLRQRVARVLFTPEPILSGKEETVLASLSFFEVPEGVDAPVQTTLTTGDFRDLYASYNQTEAAKQPLAVANQHREERGLPPLDDHQTVNVPHEPEVALTERELQRTATSVREALRTQVADVADELNVAAGDGAITVRGPVLGQEDRTKTEHVARAAAGRVRVEFAWGMQR